MLKHLVGQKSVALLIITTLLLNILEIKANFDNFKDEISKIEKFGENFLKKFESPGKMKCKLCKEGMSKFDEFFISRKTEDILEKIAVTICSDIPLI